MVISGTVDADSFVYCGVFSTGENIASVSAIKDQLIFERTFNNSANITVSGLVPITSYDVYCVALSLYSPSHVDLASVVSLGQNFTTLCCKEVLVNVNFESIRVGEYLSAAVSVRVSHLPTVSIDIRVQNETTVLPALVTFEPSVLVDVYAHSIMQTYTFDAVAVAAGDLYLDVVVSGSGPAKAEYSVVYVKGASNPIIDVLSSSSNPLVPVLNSVEFAADGATVLVSFSSATNQGGKVAYFNCTELLNFVDSSLSRCRWSTAKEVVIEPASSVAVGSGFNVVAGVLRAACVVSTSACSAYGTVSASATTISAPASPQTPRVVLTYPAILSSCSDWSLDLTSSVGSGGRAWSSVAFEVAALPSTVNVTGLSMFLRDSYTISPPADIPAELFVPGSDYMISVRLCNFLGVCDSGYVFVEVRTSEYIPVVTLLGAPRRTMKTSDILSIDSDAFVIDCAGNLSYDDLEFSWVVFLTGDERLDVLVSQSVDASKFKLSAFNLAPGNWYQVRLEVTNALLELNTFASVVVSVVPGSLVASISEGSLISLRAGSVLELDGSGSHDEDDPDSFMDEINFVWSCVQLSPLYNSSCVFDVFGKLSNGKRGILDGTYTSSSSTTSVVTLEISDSKRISRASIEVKTVDAGAAELSFGAVSNPVNPNLALSLRGFITSVPSCEVSWSSSTLALSNVTLTPQIINSPENAVLFPLSLKLAANALTAKVTYRFFLSCGSTSAALDVIANGPPEFGSVTITPSSGTELQTKFLLTASNWFDENLPVTYQFKAKAGSEIKLQGRSQVATVTTDLPAGDTANGNELTCIGNIFDALGASSRATLSATVATSSQSAGSLLTSLSTKLAASTGNLGATTNAISVYSAVANALSASSIDCTSAPDCAYMNRTACSAGTESHTCGACLDGFVGEAGPENSACVTVATARYMRANSTGVVNKTCSGDCNGNGNCTFINVNTGKMVATCGVYDINCRARCRCNSGFTGKGCLVTTAAMVAAIDLRNTLFTSMAAAAQIEEPSDDMVSSLVAGLSELSSVVSEISVESADTMFDVALIAVATAKDLGLTSETVEGLLDVVNTAAVIASSSEGGSGRRRLDVSGSVANSRAVLSDYGIVSMNSMVLGQEPAVYVDSAIKSSVQVNDFSAEVQLAVPQSELEATYEAVMASVSVAPMVGPGAPVNLATAVGESRAVLFGDDGADFSSNPVWLQARGTNGEVISTIVTIAFQNIRAAPYELHNDTSPENSITTVCAAGEVNTTVSYCPGEIMVTHACNLTAGTLVTQCPLKHVFPSCRVLVAEGDSCVVSAYSDTNTTCTCTLGAGTSAGARRSLQTAAETQSMEVVPVVSTEIEAIETEFTLLRQQSELENLGESTLVLLIMGGFWVLGLVLLTAAGVGVWYAGPKHDKQAVTFPAAAGGAGDGVRDVESNNHDTGLTPGAGDSTTGSVMPRNDALALQQYVQSLTPSIYSEGVPFLSRAGHEMSHKHRYLLALRAVFAPSGRKRDVLAVLQMITLLSTFLFAIALFYSFDVCGLFKLALCSPILY